jgi:hypothetical protein
MAKTKISDVIVPEVFGAYVIAQTTEKNALIDSGIMVPNERLSEFLLGGGSTVNLPRWNVISGDDEVLSDSTPLTPGKNDAGNQIATRLLRGRAWSTNELAGVFAGSDPAKAIAQQLGAYWKGVQQNILLSTLKGAFGGALASTYVKDISSGSGTAAIISATATLDTKQLLGDAAGQIVAVMMHSATKTELQKQNLIENIPNARGEIVFQSYLGYRIVEDDRMPVNSGVYDTYFFTAGAIGYANVIPETLTAVETDRDSLQGDDFMINRQCLAMHPAGLNWKGMPAESTPTNAELSTATNWDLAYTDPKEIGLLCLRHKLT